MAGINQLPAGSEYAAAIALTYTCTSWICSAIFIWLTWVHRERRSYVAILGYFTLFSTTASIIQQIHDITWYEEIMVEQFERKRIMGADNPELAIANGSFGMDLVLYYIQYYSYNVQAMLVMFWAGELAQSIYGLQAKHRMRRILRKLNAVGKVVSIVLPLITILLLRIPAIQRQFVVFILLADLPLMLSLAIGSSTMIAILIRYVQGQKKFSQWTPPGQGSSAAMSEVEGTQFSTSQDGGVKRKKRRPSLYDRWLMVRFTFAFVLLAVFEVTNTLFQITAIENNKKDAKRTEPDLSVERARSTMFLFMPGVTAGIFVFLIFGTTAGCRKKMRETFLPKRWHTDSRKRPNNRRRWPWRRVTSGTHPTQPEHLPDPNNPFDAHIVDDGMSIDMTPVDMTKAKEMDWAMRNDDMKHPTPQPDVNVKNNFSRPLPPVPVPIAPPMSRYNRKNSRDELGQDAVHMKHDATEQRVDSPSRRIRNMRSLDQMREDDYQLTLEHSDDSGLILPIQSPRDSTGSLQEMRLNLPRRTASSSSGRRIRRPTT